MDDERLEYIRQKVQDGVMWADVADHIKWSLEELELDHEITRAELLECLDRLDWQIVILPESESGVQTYGH